MAIFDEKIDKLHFCSTKCQETGGYSDFLQQISPRWVKLKKLLFDA
jgi:hypothetical protein